MIVQKNWFTSFFRRSLGEKDNRKCLFKFIPFVHINSLLLGVPLITPAQVHHRMLHIFSLLAHIFVFCFLVKRNFEQKNSMVIVSDLLYNSMGMIAFFLLLKKRKCIVDFISSDESLAPKLKRIDTVWTLTFSSFLFLEYFCVHLSPLLYEFYETKFLLKFLNSFPTLQRILIHLMAIGYVIMFQTEPMCLVLYSLGYCVLYSYKFGVLKSTSSSWQVDSLRATLLKLQSVTKIHDQFERTFGPFLLVLLCYNFVSAVYFIYFLNLLISSGVLEMYYTGAFTLFSQLISIVLILVISIYNERLKKLSLDLSDQLELNLGGNSVENFLMVKYLQCKIVKCINQPLTACKMVTIRRHIVLTIITSCVTFSVLFIQIYNGSLITSH